MSKLSQRLASLAFALSSAAVFAAPVEFKWPTRGTIHFDVPETWRLSGSQAGDIGFGFNGRPKSNAAAVLQITLAAKRGMNPVDSADLPKLLEKAVHDYLPGSVEKIFDPRPLPLSQGTGYFMHLTDASLVGKPPQPGDYQAMRSAVAALDSQALVIVTMNFNDPAGHEVAEMMAMVQSMRFIRKASSSPSNEANKPFTFSHPESRVQLAFSSREFEPMKTEAGYFLGAIPSEQVTASGWFEPAERYGGLAAFWEKESGGKINGTLGRDGDWETVLYQTKLDEKKLSQHHLRAELVRDGTWVDLHFSTVGAPDDPECIARLRRTLRSIVISNK